VTRHLCFFAVILLGSCSQSGLQVDLHVQGKDLTDVYVIAGLDKLYWPRLHAGEFRTVRSTAKLPAELTVLYTLNKENHSSRGPDLTSYGRVEIVIDGESSHLEAAVTYRILPRGR
jgi:hypothetical protein